MDKVSIVISFFNEEKGIVVFKDSLLEILSKLDNYSFEVLWIDDGSTDSSLSLLQASDGVPISSNIDQVIIELSKNFGHEAAMIAGIDQASGDVVICMDADGQHSPTELHRMIESYHKGHDIVLMERVESKEPLFKRISSSLFYKLINLISDIKLKPMSSDFFLVSRKVAEVLGSYYREKNRFIRGFIQTVGFPLSTLKYKAADRAYGESHYSLNKLIKLAIDATFTFSFKPLRVSLFLSIVFVLFSIVLSGYTLYQYVLGSPPSGYTTLLLFSSFSFSFLFLIISILSLYFEKMIDEMRSSPLYIVKRIEKLTIS